MQGSINVSGIITQKDVFHQENWVDDTLVKNEYTTIIAVVNITLLKFQRYYNPKIYQLWRFVRPGKVEMIMGMELGPN